MAWTSWPFDTIDTTETQYSQLFRYLQNTGIVGRPGDTNAKVTGDSSGLNVKVAAGSGFVRGHFFLGAAIETLVIGAGNTSPRIDIVVARLNPTTNSITPVVIAGTPAATPSRPALTQTDAGNYDLLLAEVYVGAGVSTIAAGNVTDYRTFAGTQFGVWTTTTRPVSPTQPVVGFNTTLGYVEHNPADGTGWKYVISPAIDAATITSGTLDSNRLPTVPVTKGGTGAVDAATARTNLAITPVNIGAAAAVHVHAGTDITSGAVAVANGGTGATLASAARTNLSVPSVAEMTAGLATKSDTGHVHSAADVTSGTLVVARGGTGASTLTGYVKGAGTSAMTASPTVPAADVSGQLAVANGGTGATDAATARTNLSAANAVHTHLAADITDQANIDAGKVNGVKVSVQATQPTSPILNQLWFWGS